MLNPEEPYVLEESDGVMKVRTCAWSPPGDHPVGWGVVVTVKDNKILKVEGDPDHPITQGRLDVRNLSLDEVVYSKERLQSPMVRDRADRGKDAWKAVSWDEAYDLIESKIREVWEKWGAETIFTLTGTGRESTLYAPVYGPAICNTPNGASTYAFSGEACYGPRATITNYLLGAGVPEIDSAQYWEDRYDHPGYVVPKYIMVWGKDPLFSSPDGFFGPCIIDLIKRGSKIITVDPRLTWLGAKAEYHLQLRPGTDAAVGMGFLNVIISEGLYDKEFVDCWTYGFNELAEAVKEWTPERVQEVSWVDPEVLVGAARAFATNSPSTATWGVALDQSKASTQAAQCFLAICTICGYIDVPGGITITKPTSFIGQWRYDMMDVLDPEMAAKHIIDPDGKYSLFNAGAAMGGVQGDTLLNWLEGKWADREDYYKLRMCWIIGNNPLACMADQPQRWYEAMKDLEFIVVNDIFMTPTIMGLADVVLPLSTYVEHEGLVTPNYGRNQHFIGAMNKIIENPNTKSDLEILIDMGRRMRPELWEGMETPDKFFDAKLRENYGYGLDEVKAVPAKMAGYEYKKYEKGLLRADGKMGFQTSTGRIELWSPVLRNYGEQPLPYFEEPEFSHESKPELKEEFPLYYTTGGRHISMFHSEHRQADLTTRKLHPWPLVTLHPETAAQYGIQNGDWVEVTSPQGRMVQKASISLEVTPKFVHVEHAWWFPEQCGEAPNLYGVFKANANNLIPHESVSVTGYGAPYKNGICKIRKVANLEGDPFNGANA
ncbi:MAG: molybdopterin-dependent oxidoreductase [Eggerthellales bacterium]|nr:molybdopterin-dependent oxidoreductase [Eggerthellales bacterium]